MRAPKMWPYRLLGLESEASLAQARAAHARLCARCGSTPLEQDRRARYDAALAWCLDHWLDAGPLSADPQRPRSHTRGQAVALVPSAPPSAPDTSIIAVRPVLPPICRPSVVPSSAPVHDPSLVRCAINAYRAAQAACAASPVVRVWKA